MLLTMAYRCSHISSLQESPCKVRCSCVDDGTGKCAFTAIAIAIFTSNLSLKSFRQELYNDYNPNKHLKEIEIFETVKQ